MAEAAHDARRHRAGRVECLRRAGAGSRLRPAAWPGPTYQRTQYVENGGQPGHRAAWVDAENNRRTRDYFMATLPCLDRAYLRPRYPGSLAFQDRDGGGVPIRAFMMDGGDPRAVMETLNRMYRASRSGAA